VKLLLGLAAAPSPHDAADALAVAICHMHSMPGFGIRDSGLGAHESGARIPNPESRIPDKRPRTWRQYRPPTHG
jgi:hypothetical protein